MDNQPKTIIRDIEQHDIAEVMALGEMLHEESVYRDIPYDADSVLTTLAQAMYHRDYYFRGAFHTGTLTGAMIGFLAPYFFSKEFFANEVSIYVHPDKRGASAANRLIRDFIEWGKERGAREVSLSITSGIKPERTAKLYDKIGVSRVGTIHKMELRDAS